MSKLNDKYSWHIFISRVLYSVQIFRICPLRANNPYISPILVELKTLENEFFFCQNRYFLWYNGVYPIICKFIFENALSNEDSCVISHILKQVYQRFTMFFECIQGIQFLKFQTIPAFINIIECFVYMHRMFCIINITWADRT